MEENICVLIKISFKYIDLGHQVSIDFFYNDLV